MLPPAEPVVPVLLPVVVVPIDEPVLIPLPAAPVPPPAAVPVACANAAPLVARARVAAKPIVASFMMISFGCARDNGSPGRAFHSDAKEVGRDHHVQLTTTSILETVIHCSSGMTLLNGKKEAARSSVRPRNSS
jgi:hypothetical protein